MERYFVNQKNHNQVIVGGVRRLKEFASDMLVLTVAGAEIHIKGDKLMIASFHANEIIIKGKIENVETIKTSTRGAK